MQLSARPVAPIVVSCKDSAVKPRLHRTNRTELYLDNLDSVGIRVLRITLLVQSSSYDGLMLSLYLQRATALVQLVESVRPCICVHSVH